MRISVDGNSKTYRYGTIPLAHAFQLAANISYIFACYEDIGCSEEIAPLTLQLGPR